MKQIKYIDDNELKYKKNVLDGLQAYNNTQTGVKEFHIKHYYILDEDRLVGAFSGILAWDWIYFGDLFYQNPYVLKSMINHLSKNYMDKAVGMMYYTFVKERKDDFIDCGFHVKSTLPNMPKGQTTSFLYNTEYEYLNIKQSFKILEFDEINKDYNEILKEEVELYKKQHNISVKKIELEFVALDDDQFVGGVYGYIELDYLYVNLLYVDESYRGHRIATKLMDLIEEEAINKGLENVFLGTCDFQAYDFYVKRNYTLHATVKDLPKGFNEYTFVKKLI
ncbi:GNAT family N-acetyltransferase [Candidatus Izimaplasma bacterium]|nr:GNAT family N-acetyltransferase [Candidatus Izimaplasma bacterium]